jgi:hypothetical protein
LAFAFLLVAVHFTFDSAEEPQMIKTQQFKTPPKQSTHFRKIHCGPFWSEVFLSVFEVV